MIEKALKLSETLGLGSFEACFQALAISQGDEAQAVEYLLEY
jgi:hypothetical protein